MRYLFILLTIISLCSFASAQDEKQDSPPIADVFPIPYSNINNLKVFFDSAATKLKIFTELKIYIVYYKGLKQNKSDFNSFKLKAQKILVKSNKIDPERISIIDSGNDYYDSSSFIIWILDKNGKPID